MLRRTFFAIFLISFISCAVQAEEIASPFQEISFETALRQAQQEHKIVFIDFFTTWCGPCKMLDATTWRNPDVIALLKEKTIALKVDAEKNVDLANRYPAHAYPTLILIKPDESVIDTLVGYQDAKTFTGNFNSALTGKTSLERAEEAVEKSKQSGGDTYIQARYNLGQELAYKGKNAEALAEYLWCYDDGMKKEARWSGPRSSFLLGDISNLGKRYPPALDALKARRIEARMKISATPTDSSALRDFADLNHNLGEDRETLAYFNKLPPKSNERATIGYYVFDSLLDAQRYSDAISAQPYAKFQTFYKRLSQSLGQMPAEEAISMREDVVTTAAKELEALAGANQMDDAHNLMKAILDFDKSANTIGILRVHLTRAGHPELMPLSQ